MLFTESNVTVVVPVYNVERYIHRCIDSLLLQTQRPLEIILVNDGSTDSSGAICDEYADKYGYIRTIHKKNGGLSSARKAGWQTAKGDLICFVDSDDYVASSYVEKLSESFISDDIALSMCSWANNRDGVITHAKLPYKEMILKNTDISEQYILPVIGHVSYPSAINLPGFVPVRMYRRVLLQASDFVSEREYFTEDIILNILYAKRIVGEIAIINEPLYYYCINPGSLTMRYRENAFEMRLKCNRFCQHLTETIAAKPEHIIARLDANMASAITYALFNIGQLANYWLFREKLTQILSTREVKQVFTRHHWPMAALWHKIIYYCCKMKAYLPLYILLKMRKIR